MSNNLFDEMERPVLVMSDDFERTERYLSSGKILKNAHIGTGNAGLYRMTSRHHESACVLYDHVSYTLPYIRRHKGQSFWAFGAMAPRHEYYIQSRNLDYLKKTPDTKNPPSGVVISK